MNVREIRSECGLNLEQLRPDSVDALEVAVVGDHHGAFPDGNRRYPDAVRWHRGACTTKLCHGLRMLSRKAGLQTQSLKRHRRNQKRGLTQSHTKIILFFVTQKPGNKALKITPLGLPGQHLKWHIKGKSPKYQQKALTVIL